MKIQAIIFVVAMSLINSLTGSEEIKSVDVSPFDYSLEKILSEEDISSKIEELARVIEKDYENSEICVVAILKGSLWFATDFIKALKVPNSLETLSCSSYGKNGTVSGELTIAGLERLDIKGKHVLLVDDICDTGKTLSKVIKKLEGLEPKSIKSMVLLSKKIRKPDEYQPDYFLFEIENLFVVGYGLDYKEYYRGLPGVYILGHHD